MSMHLGQEWCLCDNDKIQDDWIAVLQYACNSKNKSFVLCEVYEVDGQKEYDYIPFKQAVMHEVTL